MSASETEDEPLDPALERVRQRLMRLMLVSIGILMIGIFAVLGTVIYRISTNPDEKVAQQAIRNGERALVETSLGLEAGEKITSYHVTQEKLVVEVAAETGQVRFVFVDLLSGQVSAVVNP